MFRGEEHWTDCSGSDDEASLPGVPPVVLSQTKLFSEAGFDEEAVNALLMNSSGCGTLVATQGSFFAFHCPPVEISSKMSKKA